MLFFALKSHKKLSLMIYLVSFCILLLLINGLPLTYCETTQILDPLKIPKFVNQIDKPSIYVPTNITDSSNHLIRQEYSVKVVEFTQQILPISDANGNPTGFNPTRVWGYEGEAKNALTSENLGTVASTPGSTFETIQGIPLQVKWVNSLVDSNGKPLNYSLPVDPTLHWANPKNMEMPSSPNAPAFPPGFTEAQTPVPIVTHLHGGEVQSTSDGHPEAWWTADGKHGPTYNTTTSTEINSAVFVYPNEQQPTTLWYHDHALGLTRLNVLSGLSGLYIIRNESDHVEAMLPKGENEIPLIIQDRTFLTDGSLYYVTQGVNPNVHPYWQHFFLGNAIIVNGKAWPNLNVKQGQYRFRILDASNSRYYMISFSNNMPFTLIGTDGGYVKSACQLTSLLLAPAERADILVDFSNIQAGTKIILKNFAGFSDTEENLQTTGQIMQFTVVDQKGFTPNELPSNLNPTLSGDFPTLSNPEKERILTFINVGSISNPTMILLNGQKWSAPTSETPAVNSTEDWILVNPTSDAHPIHVHLVQFQIVSHQQFNITPYMQEWTRLNGDLPLDHSTVNVPSLQPYLIGTSSPPSPNEEAWKDTVNVNSGEALVIRLRWTQQDGSPFPFDATTGPGYVWHCHLLEHEDNEMMRPYTVTSSVQNTGTAIMLAVVITIVTVILLGLIVIIRKHKRAKH